MDLIAVPDLQLLPNSTTSHGTTVCSEITITGTNTGPTKLGDFGHALFGADVDRLEPSGRSFELPACSCTRSERNESPPNDSTGDYSSTWSRSAPSEPPSQIAPKCSLPEIPPQSRTTRICGTT
jgi:hypothetical protein